jgi:hypothetical protein
VRAARPSVPASLPRSLSKIYVSSMRNEGSEGSEGSELSIGLFDACG